MDGGTANYGIKPDHLTQAAQKPLLVVVFQG